MCQHTCINLEAYNELVVQNNTIEANQAIQLIRVASSSSAVVQDNVFRENGPRSANGDYISVLFQTSSFDADILLTGNLLDGRFRCYSDRARLVTLYSNSWKDFECKSHCLELSGSAIEMHGNLLKNLSVLEPYSLLAIDSSMPNIVTNRIEGCSGFGALDLIDSPATVNFTDNVVVDSLSLLAFYVKTSMLFGDVEGGFHVIGANFWDTTSFVELQNKTFDARLDSDLALITYVGLYLDENLTSVVSAPPLGSILDLVSKMIGGTMLQQETVVVPEGLYYAPESIILRHPGALLVVEAGARIMFAPGALIRIDEGELHVLGAEGNQVELTSTDRHVVEYGDPTIPSSAQWGGIWFGPLSNASSAVEGEYVDGSLLRHCLVANGGFTDEFPSASALYFDEVSVVLDNLMVDGSGGHGVMFNRPMVLVLLHQVHINATEGSGLYIPNPQASVTLEDVMISDSDSYGLLSSSSASGTSHVLERVSVTGSRYEGIYFSYIEDIEILGSYFVGNYLGGGTQVYLENGKGTVSISSR